MDDIELWTTKEIASLPVNSNQINAIALDDDKVWYLACNSHLIKYIRFYDCSTCDLIKTIDLNSIGKVLYTKLTISTYTISPCTKTTGILKHLSISTNTWFVSDHSSISQSFLCLLVIVNKK